MEDRLQPSLFTRLQAVEAELQVMKDLLAELTVNHDGLRRDRDEWRWRAERLLKDRERGMFWRWRRRVDAAHDRITAISSKLFIGVRAKLDRTELRQHVAAGPLAWFGRIRKAAQPAYRRSSS